MQEWAKFLQFRSARSCSPGPNGDGTYRRLPVELNRCREIATAFSPRENISAIQSFFGPGFFFFCHNLTCVCCVAWPVLIKNERKAKYHNSWTQSVDTLTGCIQVVGSSSFVSVTVTVTVSIWQHAWCDACNPCSKGLGFRVYGLGFILKLVLGSCG